MIRYIYLLASSLVIAGLVVLVFLLPNTESNTAQTPNEAVSNSFVISNAQVFDGYTLLDKQHIRISNGVVSDISADLAIKSDDVVINASGKTLLPGFIDAHTHTYGNGLEDALRFGVSTHLDMFTGEESLTQTRETRASVDSITKTDLFSAGTLATVEGGHGTQFGFAIDTIDAVDEIATWVVRRKQAGSDYIKLVYMPYQDHMPSLNRKQAKEVIKQAKAQNMLVMAHISSQAAAKDMMEDGINGLVHVFADSEVTDEVLALAKQNNVFINPTLAVIASADARDFGTTLLENENIADSLSAQQKATLGAGFGFHGHGFDFDIAKQNVAKFYKAGVTILAGSDAPNPGTAYGISAHHELQLLVQAGMSNIDALKAITSSPADIFSLDGRGVIKKGARADFMLLNADPVNDIQNTLSIYKVFKNGMEVERELNTISSNGQEIKSGLLGNFDADDKLASIEGFSWSHTDDSMANGQSKASIEVVSNNALNSNVLVVQASVKSGFPYPWAGASVGDFELPIDGKNISKYQHIVFDIKGTPATYRVMAFDAANAGIPPSVDFKISTQWQSISIPLADLKGFNTTLMSGFAIVAGPQPGEYEFYVDNVRLE